ncbi:acyl-CoA dehydrogenase [Myxococcaceae bacterium]|jgi:alkylation response protein AidB-like acyl-CoA dehydrogenase|nr:acyl-CoA dehydrogenase [Myxococcaceae bacterium]
MADLEEFRVETNAWLRANGPASIVGTMQTNEEGIWGGRKAVFPSPDAKRWLAIMAERGWTAPTWPREYGGGGLSPDEARVLSQEMAKLRLPPPLVGFGLTMIGPTLLQFGNEDQRREHLPKICRGEIRWCQGYSEPDAGSDLASLKTRAVREGDDLVVTGQKVWTSYADKSDWIFALVRSDPHAKKQEGITFLLIDMATPGVSVRPIQLISGASPFCETYFDEVRVPLRNVIGALHGGWTVAKALLGHERSMIADVFGGGARKGASSALVEIARRHLDAPEGPLPDPIQRDRIAQTELDARCFALTVQRSRDGAKAGHRPGPETSMFKYYATELNERRHELMVRIAGPQGLGWEGEGFVAEDLALTRAWLRSRGNSIEGGTSEIQLNVIAKRVLGLPD